MKLVAGILLVASLDKLTTSALSRALSSLDLWLRT